MEPDAPRKRTFMLIVSMMLKFVLCEVNEAQGTFI